MSDTLSGSQFGTPENAIRLKNTPLKSSGTLNKTLFTPCRRLGLSRKISKSTPSGRSKDESPVNLSVSTPQSRTSQVRVNDETPKNKHFKLEESKRNVQSVLETEVEKQVEERVEATPPIQKNSKPRNKAGLKWSSNDEETVQGGDDKNEENCRAVQAKKGEKMKKKGRTMRSKNKKCTEPESSDSDEPLVKIATKVNKNNKEQIKKDQSVINVKENLDIELKNKNEKSKETKLVATSQKKHSVEATNSKNGDLIRQNLEPVVVLKEIQTLNINNKSKSLRKVSSSSLARRLSLKKTNSQNVISDEDDLPSLAGSSVSLLSNDELTEEHSVDLEEMSMLKTDISTVKKKKRCVIYSSDEDDFIPSQPKTETDKNDQHDNESLIEKINDIKTRIKKKEGHLAELKQAAIYKRLHNVEELNQLTNIWTTGCKDGLTHLLNKLKEHADMDMPMLMRNLNIPDTIIYNAETDSFK